MINQHNESYLLRMTKDELIDHIHELYKDNDGMHNALSEWWSIVDSMKHNERFRQIYENCS